MNSKSGRKHALHDRQQIEDLLSLRGLVHTYITTWENDKEALYRLKKENPGIRTVVVCGGDGTMNICLHALYDFDDLRYIFLPYGTRNIFAKENCYPKSNLLALKMILNQGTEKTLYAGSANGRPFFLLLSIGVDSHIVEKIERKGKKFGLLSYISGFFRHLRTYDFRKSYRVTVDGNFSGEGNFILVSNCTKYGAAFEFTPRTSMYSDHYKVLVVKADRAIKIIAFILKAVLKRHLTSPAVKMTEGKSILIEGEGLCQMDGEIGEPLPLTIFKDKGVRFVLPHQC